MQNYRETRAGGDVLAEEPDGTETSESPLPFGRALHPRPQALIALSLGERVHVLPTVSRSGAVESQPTRGILVDVDRRILPDHHRIGRESRCRPPRSAGRCSRRSRGRGLLPVRRSACRGSPTPRGRQAAPCSGQPGDRRRGHGLRRPYWSGISPQPQYGSGVSGTIPTSPSGSIVTSPIVHRCVQLSPRSGKVCDGPTAKMRPGHGHRSSPRPPRSSTVTDNHVGAIPRGSHSHAPRWAPTGTPPACGGLNARRSSREVTGRP